MEIKVVFKYIFSSDSALKSASFGEFKLKYVSSSTEKV